MEWRAHSDKQESAIFSLLKILALLTGIQYGKTSVGAVRTKIKMHTYTRPDDNFIIGAPTYKIMAQSTLPAFLSVMRGVGEYHKADAVFKMHGGGTCYMRTGTDPDSVVGITNVRHVWGDEAGKFSLLFWQNLQARAAFRDCQIDLTSSPYTLNWIYKEIVRPKQRDPRARPDVNLIQAASYENPLFPRAEYDRNKLVMEPRRFNMTFGGEWEKPAGLVYGCFDEVENTCDPFLLPAGTVFYAGIDWGFTKPFAIVVRAITPGGMHYQVSEVYRTGLTTAAKIQEAARLKIVYGIKLFYADPEEPASILAFNQAGLPTIAAENAVKTGVDEHYELIKARRYKVFRGSSPHTLDEYDNYHWPELDEIEADDDEEDPNPVENFNHALDANRYVTVMTKAVTDAKRAPRAPEEPRQEDIYKRLERHKREPRRRGHSENWSA